MTANFLTAREAHGKIAQGEISSEELVRNCLDRIVEYDGAIGAWAYLDPDYAIEQARQRDDQRKRGLPLGPLHGLPVGIKDIIDTGDMPTEHGTPLHAGRTPAEDATVVEKLREAGAVIMGKTVSTELAVMSPGKTTNPHDAGRTPGGSSSGSAAAVASFMVPLAVGTQTNGSVIRPASFCGVFGFKPTYGRISRHRVLAQSFPLDTIGVFARSLEDVALISDVLMEYDRRDRAMQPRGRPRLGRTMAETPPMEPHLAFVRSPVWDQADESSKDAFRELISAVEERVDIVQLPPAFDQAHALHQKVMEADLARSFAREYRDGKDRLSASLREILERGQKVLATEYLDALDQVQGLQEELAEIFLEYDAIMTPATPGEAPQGLETTGNPAFCTIWTLCGTPAITLPLLQGPADMPIGVQMVGNRQDDGRLLRTCNWLINTLVEDAQ